MASKVAAKVGKSMLAKQAEAMAPRDPIWETYTDANGVQKRRRRAVPLGLTKKEQKILKKVRKRAHRLDKGFSICGFRFGWTAIIGLIPVLGDMVDALLSYLLVIRPARKCDLPVLLVERMLFNQAISTTIGLVPLVGDILIATWKANSRNAALFEDFLIARAEKNLASGLGSGSGSGSAGTSTNEGASASARVAAGAPDVSDAETRKLVEASKQKGYIARKTGEKPDPAAPAPPAGESATGPVAVDGSAYAGPSGTGAGAEGAKRSRSFFARNK